MLSELIIPRLLISIQLLEQLEFTLLLELNPQIFDCEISICLFSQKLRVLALQLPNGGYQTLYFFIECFLLVLVALLELFQFTLLSITDTLKLLLVF
jgi:hypothetical protein